MPTSRAWQETIQIDTCSIKTRSFTLTHTPTSKTTATCTPIPRFKGTPPSGYALHNAPKSNYLRTSPSTQTLEGARVAAITLTRLPKCASRTYLIAVISAPAALQVASQSVSRLRGRARAPATRSKRSNILVRITRGMLKCSAPAMLPQKAELRIRTNTLTIQAMTKSSCLSQTALIILSSRVQVLLTSATRITQEHTRKMTKR